MAFLRTCCLHLVFCPHLKRQGLARHGGDRREREGGRPSERPNIFTSKSGSNYLFPPNRAGGCWNSGKTDHEGFIYIIEFYLVQYCKGLLFLTEGGRVLSTPGSDTITVSSAVNNPTSDLVKQQRETGEKLRR